jgi:hypothetical protein
MRQVRWVAGGVVLAFTLAGCGESAPESGTMEFKATNSPEIEAFAKRLSENAKSKGAMKKPEAATKPAADGKAESK